MFRSGKWLCEQRLFDCQAMRPCGNEPANFMNISAHKPKHIRPSFILCIRFTQALDTGSDPPF